MATNSAEIQYALDRRGYVEIEDAATITAPINLAHIERSEIFIFMKGEVDYSGNPGKYLFGWKWDSSYTHDPAAIYIEGGVVDGNSAAQVDFLQIHPDSTKSPARITLRRSDVYVSQGYVVSGNGVPKTGSIYCEDITSYAGCCVRWIGSSWPAFDWMIVDNWRKVGGGRVGADFYIKNGRRFQGSNLIVDGTAALTAALQSNYVGPVVAELANCTGLNFIDELWFEPWGTWDTVAPDCWGFTIRADETSGNYRQHYCRLKSISLNADGLDPATSLFHAYGGDTSTNAASVRVDHVDQADYQDGEAYFGGKVFPTCTRSMAGSPFASADSDDFDNLNSGAWKQPIATDSSAHPYAVYANRVNLVGSGSAYETNHTDEPAQYDD